MEWIEKIIGGLEMRKSRLLVLFVAVVFLLAFAFTACQTQETAPVEPAADAAAQEDTATEKAADDAPATAAADDAEPVLEAKKVGVVIWGVEDSLSSAVKMILDKAAEVYNITLTYKTGDFTADAQVTAVENLVAAGIDGLLIAPMADSAMPKVVATCGAAGIPVTMMFRDIADPTIAAEVLEGEYADYYLGYCLEDEVAAAKEIIAYVAEQGVTKVNYLGTQPGFVVNDRRMQGYQEAMKEKGITILGETRTPISGSTTDTSNAVENFVVTYPEAEALIMCNAASGNGEAAVSVLTKYGETMPIAVFDMFANDAMIQAFDAGNLYVVTGGHQYDPLYAFVVLANKLHGTPFEERAELKNKYIFVKSAQEVEEYNQYLADDPTALYPEEELKMMLRAYNPDFTLADLQAIADEYTLENVKAKMEG
jgi:ABC-type sugar transport system substrate-binding protein